MDKLIGTTNVKTGKFTPAPSHCPACGRAYVEGEVTHVAATIYEVFCECGMTAVIHMDEGIKQR